MNVVYPVHLLWVWLDLGKIEIDHDRLLTAAYDDAGERVVGAGIDLLVRHVRRDVDEVAGTRLGRELEALAPPHPRLAADHVDHTFDRAVMMRTGLGVRVYYDGSRPELLRACASRCDRGGAIHSRRLRCVRVELVATHHTHSVQSPVDGGGAFATRCSVHVRSMAPPPSGVAQVIRHRRAIARSAHVNSGCRFGTSRRSGRRRRVAAPPD